MATAPVFRGSAIVAGINESITYDVVVAAATANSAGNNALTQSIKGTQSWDEEVIKDNQGYDAVWLFRNEHEMVDVDMYFVSTTAASAKLPVATVTYSAGTAGASISGLGTAPFLGAGSVINIAAGDVTAFNGLFQVQSGGDCTLTNTGAWKYTLKLKKYATTAQNTAFATTPT